MTEWDGRGLPPVAQQRLERFGAGSARTSLLSVASAAGAESVGLLPFGEVMGSVVAHLGWRGWGGCGYYGGLGGWAPTTTVFSGGPGGRSPFAGYAPYVDALYRGYDTAIRRMLEEAKGLGAHGVVGVRLIVDHIDDNREFMALGTAVRSASGQRPARLFVTELAGQDIAKLVSGGMFPVAISYGISVAVRHDDYVTRTQAVSWSNTEVSGYTELVSHVRADARRQLAGRLRSVGADGCVGVRIGMRVWDVEPAENHRDHVAEATVFGTAVVQFGPRRPAPGDAPRSVLSLRPTTPKRSSR